MPILHTQFSAQAKNKKGQIAEVPPGIALQQQGPCVQVSIGIARTIANQLLQQGKELPKPVSGIALIDTGASATCIDEAAAIKLRLPVVDVVTIASTSHAFTEQNVYPIQIEVVGLPISIEAPRARGAALSPQKLLALIGRDVLKHCTIFYNGLSGEITLSV